MLTFPALPPWNGLHPLVVHFPIALVMVTPLMVLLALILKKHSRALLLAAATLMILGAAGAWLATSTGSAAEDLAEKVPGAATILEEHEELGEAALYFTAALAGALAGWAALSWMWERMPRGVFLALGLVYLAANAAGALVISNAAHQGGRLVHEVGVRAPLGRSNSASTQAGTQAPSEKGHRDREADDD